MNRQPELVTMAHGVHLRAITGLPRKRISRSRLPLVRQSHDLAAQAVRLLRLARVRCRTSRPEQLSFAIEDDARRGAAGAIPPRLRLRELLHVRQCGSP